MPFKFLEQWWQSLRKNLVSNASDDRIKSIARGEKMVTYQYEPEAERVAAYLDNVTEVGQITYCDLGDNVWEADHTFVDPNHRGGTIARDMLDLLVSEARRQGKRIYPTCPYIVKTLERTEQYHDVYERESPRQNGV